MLSINQSLFTTPLHHIITFFFSSFFCYLGDDITPSDHLINIRLGSQGIFKMCGVACNYAVICFPLPLVPQSGENKPSAVLRHNRIRMAMDREVDREGWAQGSFVTGPGRWGARIWVVFRWFRLGAPSHCCQRPCPSLWLRYTPHPDNSTFVVSFDLCIRVYILWCWWHITLRKCFVVIEGRVMHP